MVSTTFGEKINTDRVVLDKTAAEAIAEEYPEALAKNPGFLGECAVHNICSVSYDGAYITYLEDEVL